jgi:glyoxylase-like metal-dependent hydrolase (beta-lactamase superfamily II)
MLTMRARLLNGASDSALQLPPQRKPRSMSERAMRKESAWRLRSAEVFIQRIIFFIPFRVGDLALHVIETPGHCSGMLSFVLKEHDQRLLFDGDTVFHDGKLLITNVWDCNLREYVTSIRKLAALKVDALLPGHLTISLNQGARHIQKAWDTLERLVVPPNIL